ncbi:MAG TPA: nitroreductase family protein [Candidatus Polarisedimenticolaceae bacterium]|nr:nitroreductase family protein [Candidatus Polarisedimenticolaceae bacterium]
MKPHRSVPLDFTPLPEAEMVRRARRFAETMDRRRTVRHFSERDLPADVVELAIRAAGTAPSGAHKQPWYFVAVRDAEVKRRIREAAEAEERASYEHRMPRQWLDDLEPLGTDWRKPFLEICPWLIVVFAQSFGSTDEGRKRKHYYVQESVGIAVGILLTALHLSGVATLTHTPSPMGFLREILRRPENERAYLLIALGHPVEGCRVPDLLRKSRQEILEVV